jgi:hypothetical protein
MTEPSSGQEKKALLSTLNGQREHVLGILEGLSDEALRQAVLPSRWDCLGLVHHLAIDVERFWFRSITTGEVIEVEQPAEDAWHVGAEVPAESVLALYRQEIDLANAIIEATPLDAPPAGWPEDRWPNWRLQDLRETMLHVISETACHAGHLDAVREIIDGRQWLVLTG